MNDFGCLVRDQNLVGVVSMVIHFLHSNDGFCQYFITSEEAFNLAKVAILALSK